LLLRFIAEIGACEGSAAGRHPADRDSGRGWTCRTEGYLLMKSAVRLLWRALPGLAFWAVAGCQVLINGEVRSIHCTQGGAIGPGACPAGHICAGGACVKFVPSELEPQPQLGVVCEGDADCESGDFCLDMERLQIQGGKRCSRPCCSSSGCDPAAGF